MTITFIAPLALALAAIISAPAGAQDMEKGKEILAVCAACHGDKGQGGKRGEYPRIAGQPAKFTATQLQAFRARKRINIPMYPYTQERELPDEDIRDISAYLATIKLDTKMPQFKGDEDALTRLEMVDKVMIVARVEGDIVNGGRVYQDECAECHGKTGQGRGHFPRLVGQYTNYLQRQMDAYLKGERPHEDNAGLGVLAELKDGDIRDILAYLTSIQDQE